jgi:hypothetical protein
MGPQPSPPGGLPGGLPIRAQWGGMDDTPDHRWLSYREIAEALGLPSVKAAAHRTRRAGWRREEGNGPAVRIAVPISVLEGVRRGPLREGSDPAWGGSPHPSPGVSPQPSPAIPNDALVGELREQLARSRGELDGLRVALRVAETAAAEANQRALAVQAEAVEARSATARAAAQVAEERAARQAAEAARDTAAAAAEAVRVELAELTAGGPLRRALRAFAFRRGRP